MTGRIVESATTTATLAIGVAVGAWSSPRWALWFLAGSALRTAWVAATEALR